ncbi:MAG: prolyl oligopeptidase family serine peptidase [Bdellovibrionota bacterium]
MKLSAATILCLFLSTTVYAAESTNSEKFSWLEQDSVQRKNFIGSSNLEVNNALSVSSNYKIVKDTFFKIFAIPSVKGMQQAADKTFSLVYEGLGKGTSLYVSQADGPKELLFSNLEIKKNGVYQLDTFWASPDGRFLTLTFSKKGSTDDSIVRIFNVEQKKLVSEEINASFPQFFWGDNTNLAILLKEGCFYWNATPSFFGENPAEQCYGPRPPSAYGWTLGFDQTNNRYFLTRDSDGAQTYVEGYPIEVYASEKYLYYRPTNIPMMTQSPYFYRVAMSGEPNNELFVELDHSTLLGSPLISNGALIFGLGWGAMQKLWVIDEDSKTTLADIKLPEYAQPLMVKYHNEKNQVAVTLTSQVQESVVVAYDLKTKQFSSENLQDLLKLGSEKKDVISKVIMVKTSDANVDIPARITHLKSLELNGNNPVFFHVYGGFGISDFNLQHSEVLDLFLEHGGIIVQAAPRGGGEFGQAWHQAGSLAQKTNTFSDIASVAKYLISSGYTKPSKIILTGTSNGGLVTAATALMYPELFGLAIPINGVYDMLKRAELDPAFSGWNFEYGDVNDPEILNITKMYSPVEVAKKSLSVNFLIINGRNDTRVNPAHSFKLKAALSEANTSNKNEKFVYLTSVNNAGHGAESPINQDMIGWRVQVVMWTMIYDYLGIKLKNHSSF